MPNVKRVIPVEILKIGKRVQFEVMAAYSMLGTWEKVAELYSNKTQVSKAMAYRVGMQGYIPRNPNICEAFGFPRWGYALACPHCGEIHTRKTCPNRTSSTPRERASINLQNPRSSAKTITSKMEPELVEQLADLLCAKMIK